jgi:hypothetical protein
VGCLSGEILIIGIKS